MKTKVIYSNYDEDNGVSTVTIQTKDGRFTATSKLHSEDKKIASSFAGCRYAETKAEIKYLKFKLTELKKQIRVFETFNNELKKNKKYNSENYESKEIEKFLNQLKQKQKQLENYIPVVEEGLHKSMYEREKLLTKFQKGKKG